METPPAEDRSSEPSAKLRLEYAPPPVRSGKTLFHVVIDVALAIFFVTLGLLIVLIGIFASRQAGMAAVATLGLIAIPALGAGAVFLSNAVHAFKRMRNADISLSSKATRD
jgi:hypothetical protein